jgi:xanthine dehydrogenase accessory factor
MKNLFLTCLNLMENGEDVVMITIIDQAGSAPRTAGSRMLVRQDGNTFGTIGGGLFEAQATEIAQEVFRSGQAMTRAFRFSGVEVTAMDMICGGGAQIYVDLLQSRFPENAAVCRAISELSHHDHGAWLVTKIMTGQGSEDQIKLALLTGRKQFLGISFTEEERNTLEHACKGRQPVQVKLGETTYLIEPVQYPGTVYIFGAGHVSQKLASLTTLVGFQTVILDDRREYANEQRFPQADQIVVPEDMETCMQDIPISGNSYLVIVTRGHGQDMTVLKQALKTDAGYIGMIASKRKRDLIYQHLRQSGIREEELGRVHSPIGIDIAAETPEEIAVSIIAELIQERARLIHD